MKYIFNINRFLINKVRTQGKKEAYRSYKDYYCNESKLFNWARECHGKEGGKTLDGELIIVVRGVIYKISSSWCEIKEG